MTAAAAVLVGVDVGTSALKVTAVAEDGTLVADQTQPYPPSSRDGFTEQDAAGWWQAACEALRRVGADRPVRAVAVTGQAPTLVAVGPDLLPLGPALTWADRRAQAEAREIASWLGATAGAWQRADAFFGTAKLLWWQRHRDELAPAHRVLAANGFIVAQLTGEATLDESTAGLLQGWEGRFAPPVRERLPVDLLPPVAGCAEVIGAVHRTAATACGLPAGTPVVAGAIDAVTSALEAGTLTAGDPTTVMTGSSTVTATAATRDREPDRSRERLIATRHAVPGVDLVITATVTSGAVIDWVCRLTGITRLPQHAADLPRTRPSRLLVFPAFSGERTPTWDADARGVISGLDLATGPEDLLLAAYEGTAYALADNLDVLGLPAGAPLRACGTAAYSEGWRQVTADVTGRPVARPVLGRGAAVGAALLAGLGTGALGLADLRRLTAPVAATAEPDPARADAYRGRLADWRALRHAATRR